MEITIFGKGNMGQAIGKNFAKAGNNVQYYASKDTAQQKRVPHTSLPYGKPGQNGQTGKAYGTALGNGSVCGRKHPDR